MSSTPTPRCAACDASSPSFACSRCGMTRYCDAACQRSHWRVHSAHCSTATAGDTPLCLDDFALRASPLANGSYSTLYQARFKSASAYKSKRLQPPGDAVQVWVLKEVSKSVVTRLSRRSHVNVVHEVLQEKAVGQLVATFKLNNLNPVYATFHTDLNLYYLSPYISRFELWHCVRGGAPPLPFTVQVVEQLVDALQALHRVGVVHRDLKPENILLRLEEEEEGEPALRALQRGVEVVVIDFGTSKDCIQPEHNSRLESVGTPEYMAPEATRPAGPTDGRLDLWSLGVILYHCVVGSTPWRRAGMGVYATMTGVLQGRVTWPAGVHPAAVDLISALLQVDPAKRLGARECDVDGRTLVAGHDRPAEHRLKRVPVKAAPPVPAGSDGGKHDPTALARRPAEDTVPRTLPRINFNAIRAHPFFSLPCARDRIPSLHWLAFNAAVKAIARGSPPPPFTLPASLPRDTHAALGHALELQKRLHVPNIYRFMYGEGDRFMRPPPRPHRIGDIHPLFSVGPGVAPALVTTPGEGEEYLLPGGPDAPPLRTRIAAQVAAGYGEPELQDAMYMWRCTTSVTATDVVVVTLEGGEDVTLLATALATVRPTHVILFTRSNGGPDLKASLTRAFQVVPWSVRFILIPSAAACEDDFTLCLTNGVGILTFTGRGSVEGEVEVVIDHARASGRMLACHAAGSGTSVAGVGEALNLLPADGDASAPSTDLSTWGDGWSSSTPVRAPLLRQCMATHRLPIVHIDTHDVTSRVCDWPAGDDAAVAAAAARGTG